MKIGDWKEGLRNRRPAAAVLPSIMDGVRVPNTAEASVVTLQLSRLQKSCSMMEFEGTQSTMERLGHQGGLTMEVDYDLHSRSWRRFLFRSVHGQVFQSRMAGPNVQRRVEVILAPFRESAFEELLLETEVVSPVKLHKAAWDDLLYIKGWPASSLFSSISGRIGECHGRAKWNQEGPKCGVDLIYSAQIIGGKLVTELPAFPHARLEISRAELEAAGSF